ncbi:hypothetical protein F7C95_03760 [Opitutia bacterium ISCC 51]|nr:hypothetical protein F7C95_03760 [Opitutae bacterium ISCC 51]QXD29097.1 hypothetical protein GA003_03740 [Opitutae bacterium ISCC 52]
MANTTAILYSDEKSISEELYLEIKSWLTGLPLTGQVQLGDRENADKIDIMREITEFTLDIDQATDESKEKAKLFWEKIKRKKPNLRAD